MRTVERRDLDPDPAAPTKTKLVLLPGLDGTEILFRPLLALLPDWVEPVVVTFPTSGNNRYSKLFEIVEAAVTDLGTFYVLGWSFSGPLALLLAEKHPERVRGVLLCASFVRAPLPLVAKLRFAAVAPVVRAIRLTRRVPGFLFRSRKSELQRDMARTWDRVPTPIITARMRAILGVDAREPLRRCPCPVLYLQGSRDTVVPRRNAEAVAREQPLARLVTIEGPHLALYTNASAGASVITAFLREEEQKHGTLSRGITKGF